MDEDGAAGGETAHPASSRCAAPPCSRSTGSGRTRRERASATAGSAPATWRCRGRRLPPARAHQRRHHQDRRLQGLGARDRGGAARASGDRRMRRRRRRRSGVGRAGVARRRAEAGRQPSASTTCSTGPSRIWRPTKFRARCRPSRLCRATPWAKSSSRMSPALFNCGLNAARDFHAWQRLPVSRYARGMRRAAGLLLVGDADRRWPSVAGAAYAQRGFYFREGSLPPATRRRRCRTRSFVICRLAYTRVRAEASGIGWQTDYPYAEINLTTRSVRADQDARQPRRGRHAELLRRPPHRRRALQLSGPRRLRCRDHRFPGRGARAAARSIC